MIKAALKMFRTLFYRKYSDGNKTIVVFTPLGLKLFILKEKLIIKFGPSEKLSFSIDFNYKNERMNSSLIDKVLKDYQLASEQSSRRQDAKELSRQWEDFNKNIEMTPLREKIHNFRRNSIFRGGYSVGNILEEEKASLAPCFSDGYGIDNKNIYREEWKSKKVLEHGLNIIEFYQRKAREIKPSILFSLTEDSQGGIIAPVYNGAHLTMNLSRFGYYLSRIMEHTKFKHQESFVACEIGAGYGGFARLVKSWYPRATFIMLDLPETLLLASFYIASNFPQARIGTISDFSQDTVFDAQKIKSYDFILLPWWYIERLMPSTVDSYFNFFSMQEMTKEFVDYYIKNIERTCVAGGYFYFENRFFNPKRYGGVAFKDYPFDNSWNVVHSQDSEVSIEQLRCRGYSSA